MSMNIFQDGIMSGELMRNKTECGNCNEMGKCIHIHRVNLPRGIQPSNRLIAYCLNIPSDPEQAPSYEPLLFLGFSCGCYAKFHRQIAHIQSRLGEKE